MSIEEMALRIAITAVQKEWGNPSGITTFYTDNLDVQDQIYVSQELREVLSQLISQLPKEFDYVE